MKYTREAKYRSIFDQKSISKYRTKQYEKYENSYIDSSLYYPIEIVQWSSKELNVKILTAALLRNKQKFCHISDNHTKFKP